MWPRPQPSLEVCLTSVNTSIVCTWERDSCRQTPGSLENVTDHACQNHSAHESKVIIQFAPICHNSHTRMFIALYLHRCLILGCRPRLRRLGQFSGDSAMCTLDWIWNLVKGAAGQLRQMCRSLRWEIFHFMSPYVALILLCFLWETAAGSKYGLWSPLYPNFLKISHLRQSRNVCCVYWFIYPLGITSLKKISALWGQYLSLTYRRGLRELIIAIHFCAYEVPIKRDGLNLEDNWKHASP